jgi:hypothetical protein
MLCAAVVVTALTDSPPSVPPALPTSASEQVRVGPRGGPTHVVPSWSTGAALGPGAIEMVTVATSWAAPVTRWSVNCT